MTGKKNQRFQEESLSPVHWQDAVNNAYADILIWVALEAGFMSVPQTDPVKPWQTLMLGLEVKVLTQKEQVIKMIAESFKPRDPALARRLAERLWEEFAARVPVKGH